MKKKLFLAGIIVVGSLLFLSACSQADSWKTVDIAGYGSIKTPKDWTASDVDGFIYLSLAGENGEKNILVQYRNDKEINEDLADIENMVWLQDENFSNSASTTKYKVDYKDGTSEELFALSFTGADHYKSTEFLCLDDSITEDTLREIAKSYRMN